VNIYEAFTQLDEQLKLDPDLRTCAQDRHKHITDILVQAGIAKSGFLQGSFARKTMLPPLHDVDKVITLGSDYSESSDPHTVMTNMQAAIAAELDDVTFTWARHALKIDLADDPFMFDTVPALELDDGTGDVLIANIDTGGWVRANPRELMQVVAARNQYTSGLFIHQVRMAKQAVAVSGIELPGLHTESIAFDAIKAAMAHADAMVAIFEQGETVLGDDYYEPTGTDLISARLDLGIRLVARDAFAKLAVCAREAVELEASGDETEALRVWADVFGDAFPEVPQRSANAAVKALGLGGSITSVGGVSTTNVGSHSARPVRSWLGDD
jgi:hypothetical protein